ncbi:MAG: ComEA family DNA-binding protein [Halomonadaceae bacterium]|nr:MAG: ComEA family DNA-binding protein [Halomonadaceae bacterium]
MPKGLLWLITSWQRTLISAVLLCALAWPVLAEEVPASININTADAQTLAQALSGIGPARAQAIVDFREQEGNFVTVDHLEEVPGIGIATVENNRHRITVE